jgi:hypothetical protein
MAQINVLGIDIAKQNFHVVGMDDTGKGHYQLIGADGIARRRGGRTVP